jgi:hypothetical protein
MLKTEKIILIISFLLLTDKTGKSILTFPVLPFTLFT